MNRCDLRLAVSTCRARHAEYRVRRAKKSMAAPELHQRLVLAAMQPCGRGVADGADLQGGGIWSKPSLLGLVLRFRLDLGIDVMMIISSALALGLKHTRLRVAGT